MKVRCIYFKPSGKYYTDGECEITQELKDKLIYPKSVGKYLREMRMLPGLTTGMWHGPFVCEVEYPELVKEIQDAGQDSSVDGADCVTREGLQRSSR